MICNATKYNIVINSELHNRLLNWKFTDAVKYLDDESVGIIHLVNELSACYGNCGFIEGAKWQIDRGYPISHWYRRS